MAGRSRLRLLALLLALLVPLARAQAVQDGRTITRPASGDQPGWSRTFDARLGPIGGLVSDGDRTWVALGPQLLGLDGSGVVAQRFDLPAEISGLDSENGALRVTTGASSVRQTFTVQGGAVLERVVLPPEPGLTDWLARAAALVPQPGLVRAALLDPTNPFLEVRLSALAQARGDRFGAITAAQRAVSIPVPFAVSVSLARELDRLGFPAGADVALDRARRDWAARGYDPAFPVSRAALRAYGDPLGYLGTLLDQRRLRRADTWIRYLREVSPRFEGYPQLYGRYASLLDAQGRSGEADEWRQFSLSLAGGTLYNLGPGALISLRDAAQLLTLALALSVLAAYLYFAAHYGPLQGRDTAELGGRWRAWLTHPLSRLRRALLSYAGLGEKLILATFVVALIAALAAWAWTGRVNERLAAPTLNMGTYGGAWFYDRLSQLELAGSRNDTALIEGLAAQLDGEDNRARSIYESAASPGPCLLNNLGVLASGRGDVAASRDLYRRALAADPALVAPAYNLELNPSSPEAQFQRTYRSAPRLCVPDQQALAQATEAPLAASVAAVLRSPWTTLNRLPTGLPPALQWLWVGGLLLLGASSLLWLLLPRLPGGRQQRRRPAALLAALLLPGSAFLDGAWGSVLLLGWASTLSLLLARLGLTGPSSSGGAPELIQRLGDWRKPLLLALLLIYALNLLALILSEASAARRERRTRRQGLELG